MPETSIVKRTHKWKPFTRRPVGRLKSRWEDGVRNDLKKMKIIKWIGQVQDRRSGRVLLRRPRPYQSCSAIEEEFFKCAGEGWRRSTGPICEK
jgi:hypothetical protein